MSVDVPVMFGQLADPIQLPRKYLVDFIECTMALEDPNVPFGKVREGLLQLRGRVLPVTIFPGGITGFKFVRVRWERTASTSIPYSVDYSVRYDTMNKDRTAVTTNHGTQDLLGPAWCLPISAGGFMWGIILAKLPNGYYHRIGSFKGGSSVSGFGLAETFEPNDITII